jgi:CelD/BcsL family acetyltransferase involved in cellulose biosynthesis
MRLHWTLQPASRLSEIVSEWDAVSRQAGALPFLEARFLLPLLDTFGSRGVRVAIACRGDRPVAAALLRGDGLGRIRTWQPSQLPLGPWLVAQGEDPLKLATSLLAETLPGTLALGLTQIDPRWNPRPACGPCFDTLDYVDTAWVDVGGTFDDYWEARGKNLRSNMRKQRSKLEAEGTPPLLETLTRPDEVAAAIVDYGRLEGAGWKGDRGTAVEADNDQGRFYGAMLREFCAAGRGRIWRLKFADKTVAMDLCIESDDTLVILKTAYDSEYRNVSPAFLLKQQAFQQVFDEGRIRRIEFYGKVMEWHTRWTEQSRMLYHANVCRWRWVARARSVLRGQTAIKVENSATPATMTSCYGS